MIVEFLGHATWWNQMMGPRWKSPPWNYFMGWPSEPSALWIAAAANLVETAKFLLEGSQHSDTTSTSEPQTVYGNQIDSFVPYASPPSPPHSSELGVALYYGHLGMVELLVKNGAHLDAREPDANIRDILGRLDKLFDHDRHWYTSFLASRGASAQRLLDLWQDLLDYDSNLGTTNRRRLYKALVKLSEDSRLLPRCFALTGLEQERQVAGGSFSDVYTGVLRGQSVAIKMMRVFENSDIDALLKGFGREALLWRQLSHPNLLPFYGLYYFQKRLCLVSPWMENGHIRAFLKKETYCTDCLLSLILDVALGLEHLHVQGVVHGDLKGDNIFVTPSRRACIADFGLSSIISSMSSIQITSSSKGSQGGTIRYQAPELHRGGHNDRCSDIYGFACVVYELLTGTAPFPELLTDGAVIMAVFQGHRPSRPPSCSASLDGLWNLLQNCWEERTDIRPTASQIVECLISPGIHAIKTEYTPDWDDTFTSRFRRRLLGQQPLPPRSGYFWP
ncbi:kinase-like domain-containing protein [Mycena leptocephala]|nr:kinase-like domain-containing protein [Mycena leptocephala]